MPMHNIIKLQIALKLNFLNADINCIHRNKSVNACLDSRLNLYEISIRATFNHNGRYSKDGVSCGRSNCPTKRNLNRYFGNMSFNFRVYCACIGRYYKVNCCRLHASCKEKYTRSSGPGELCSILIQLINLSNWQINGKFVHFD